MIQKLHNIYYHAQPKMPVVAMLGCICYPIYYPIWTWLFPQQYENFLLRLFCSMLCSLFLIIRKKPRFFIWYFYGALIVLLPFFFSFMLIKNNWSSIWLMSSIIALFIMYLVVYDGFIVVVLLAIGFGTACLALEVNGSTGFLTGFEWPYLMIVSFVLICGSVLSADHINQTNILSRP